MYAVGSLGHRRLLWMVGVRACMRFDRVQARWATCGLLVSMKKIASRKTNAPRLEDSFSHWVTLLWLRLG